MSDDVSGKQRLVLWRLALEPPSEHAQRGEMLNSKLSPKLKRDEREALQTAGLIRVERRGRSLALLLTDRGWGWLGEHMGEDLVTRAGAVGTLQALLKQLKVYLDAAGLSVPDLMVEVPPAVKPAPPSADADVAGLVEAAYMRLSDGRANVRVRLAELRAELPEIDRDRLDATLLEMATRGRAALLTLENPMEVRQEDRDAVVRTPTGHARHLIYMGD